MKIYYLNAPAGAGKTHSIVNEINRLVSEGERVILCQPTKLLIEETVKAFQDRFPHMHCEVFHGGEKQPAGKTKSVVGSIRRYLKCPFPEAHVLIITWEAFQRLKFIESRQNWNLIVDEIPQAVACFDEALKDTHRLITDYLGTLAMEDPSYSYLIKKDSGAIRKIAENKHEDKVLDVIRQLAVRLDSKYWVSFVGTEQFERLHAGDAKRLTVFSLLKPSIFQGFKSVMIAGACLTDSIFYQLFSKEVEFQEAAYAKESLLFTKHENGSTITFLYSTDERWSKRFRDGGDVLPKIVQGVEKEFDGCDFIWSANKGIDDALFGRERADKRLPQSPHGLNTFSGVDNMVFLSAHNLIPAHAKFIQEHLGTDWESIYTAVHCQHAYQATLRSSLRISKNLNPKKVFVPDLPTATWLQQQFPGSEIRFLDCGLDQGDRARRGRPKKHESGASRTAKYREQRKAAVEELNRLLFPNSKEESDKEQGCSTLFTVHDMRG